MKGFGHRFGQIVLAVLFGLFAGLVEIDRLSASGDPRYFDQGTPTVQDIWVDPVGGNDGNTGATRLSAVATLSEAWSRVPISTTLTTTGYRIRLVAGTYSAAIVPNYWESRWGTHAFPVIIEAADGAGTAHLPSLNIYDCRYLYLIGLDVSAGGGDVLHCELCDHFLVRETRVRGAAPATFAVQETIKINQSQYVYLEDNDISGAWDNAVDFVAVQYGHVQGNEIYDAGDWCIYNKGGSAYLRVEGNEIHDCGTGGFTAGQGTGFEFMTSPWIHYEAYDIRVVNNLIHDTDGAGLGVNGGYNILMAYNTLYRVGTDSHVLEVVYGERGCDGNTADCNARLTAGGWGTTSATAEPIPDRNVFLYNNLVYNPSGVQSQWQQLAIYGPRTASGASNIPSPARTDTNLSLRGNVIWNGPPTHALGIEGSSEGCQPSNPTCNATQILADNAVNTFEPQLINPASGDYRPIPSGNLYSATTYALPSFPGGDRPSPPLAPAGDLTNSVTRDYTGAPRGVGSPPGAFGADCTGIVCGDGTFTPGCEQCDDGDMIEGNGCDTNCTVTGCGNGIATAGEACDDGNSTAGDGCDPNCTATACGNGVVSTGEECDDGGLVAGDGCDGSCALDCPATPSLSCAAPTRARASLLAISDKAGTTSDKFKWKLKRAESPTAGDFGDPTVATAYRFCLYATTASTPTLALEAGIPSAATCGTPGCWTASSDRFRYIDTSSGSLKVTLRARSATSADVFVLTKGLPAFLPATMPPSQDPNIVAELRSSAGSCWSARFAAPALRSAPDAFKDKSE